MPKGIPLTEKDVDQRRREIVAVALPLFYESGYNETSMESIAAAAGIGKSTLYDYFDSKEAIMVAYFERELEEIRQRAAQIIAGELDTSKKLVKIMEIHLAQLVENRSFYLKLSAEAQRLSAAGQQLIQERRHAYQDMLRVLIEEGIQKGELRPVNPLFAARSIFMLLSLSTFTTRPTGSPEEMLQQAEDIFFNGILV
jgi:AcrR family transcriptional regulator